MFLSQLRRILKANNFHAYRMQVLTKNQKQKHVEKHVLSIGIRKIRSDFFDKVL